MGTEEKSDSLVEWKQRDANECGGPHLRELREQTGFQCSLQVCPTPEPGTQCRTSDKQ